MKFTVGELFIIRENLKKLSEIKDVTALVGYRVAAALRRFNEPMETAERTRTDLIKKYAGSPDKDNLIKVLPENMVKYVGELNELMAEELDIDIKEVKIPADAKIPDATTLVGLDRFISIQE